MNLSLKLPRKEHVEFIALCERQGVAPAAVLRELARLYVASDGSVPAESSPDLDRMLGNFLDWYIDRAAARP